MPSSGFRTLDLIRIDSSSDQLQERRVSRYQQRFDHMNTHTHSGFVGRTRLISLQMNWVGEHCGSAPTPAKGPWNDTKFDTGGLLYRWMYARIRRLPCSVKLHRRTTIKRSPNKKSLPKATNPAALYLGEPDSIEAIGETRILLDILRKDFQLIVHIHEETVLDILRHRVADLDIHRIRVQLLCYRLQLPSSSSSPQQQTKVQFNTSPSVQARRWRMIAYARTSRMWIMPELPAASPMPCMITTGSGPGAVMGSYTRTRCCLCRVADWTPATPPPAYTPVITFTIAICTRSIVTVTAAETSSSVRVLVISISLVPAFLLLLLLLFPNRSLQQEKH